MKTTKEALQTLTDTFEEFYSQKLNENEEQRIPIEEFRKRWHKIIDELYDKIENESRGSTQYLQ